VNWLQYCSKNYKKSCLKDSENHFEQSFVIIILLYNLYFIVQYILNLLFNIFFHVFLNIFLNVIYYICINMEFNESYENKLSPNYKFLFVLNLWDWFLHKLKNIKNKKWSFRIHKLTEGQIFTWFLYIILSCLY